MAAVLKLFSVISDVVVWTECCQGEKCVYTCGLGCG